MRRFVALRSALCALACAHLLAVEAEGAGYAIKEQSTTALGNAFAGATAGAKDLSYMFFNPAALAYQSGSQIMVMGHYVAPHSEPANMSARTATGTTVAGSGGGDDLAENAVVPALYGMYEVSEDLKLGIGVNAPWGLATDYDDDWVGRYHARRSELRTFNFNPAVGYRVNNWLALGAGVQVQYIDIELTNAIDFGTIGFVQTGGALGTPTRNDGAVKMEGDDWGFGFNLGVLIEPWRGTRFGAAYRSSISHDIEGSADFTLDSAGVAATLQSISAGMGQPVPFIDTGARADAEVPETVSFGLYHEFDDRWAIMGEAAWTRWSRFDELRVRFDNPGQADSVTDESWDDSWFLAGGVTYRPDEDWTFRAGVAYDQTPIPDSTRTPRLPSNDRLWLAVGASYQAMENLTVEFAFTHIFVDDATIDLTTNGVGNTFRGNLSGDFRGGAIDIVGAQVSYKF